ncbi:MAG: EAL domain-containing protein [Sideroxyarcus sp.]
MDKRLTPARIALLYAAFAGLWIFASDKLLELAVPDPALIMRISVFKGFAFVLITTWLLYLLMKTSVTKVIPAASTDTAKDGLFKPSALLAIFLGLALVVPLFGYGIARIYTPRIQKTAFDDLAAIAELKSGQIEAWLHERRGDAEVLAANNSFIEQIEQWQSSGDPGARRNLMSTLESFHSVFSYDVVLLGIDGQPMRSGKTRSATAEPAWSTLLPNALQTGEVQVSNLFRDHTGHIRLDYVVPLVLHENTPRHPVGAVVLRAPVESFLFPLIQSWPTASPSAETVLARRDGDQILYLNELRHRKGTALTLRIPLAASGMPVAVSIRTGKPQTMESTDYRGVRILAATRPIQGTDWHLVAKVDRDEVMALLKEILLWVSLVAIIVVMVVASAVLMLWRQQQRLHQLDLYARTAEQDKQLKLFYDLPFIGMAISSPTDKAWLYANDHLCDMLGYTQEELLQTTWADITHPDDLDKNVAQFERMKAGEIDGYTLEKRFLRKDGTPLSVNLDIKCTRAADGSVNHIVAMIEDITERKRTEQALRESEDRFRSIFANALDGILLADAKTKKFIMANPAMERMLGYDRDELLCLGLEDIHQEQDISANVEQFEKMTRGETTLAVGIPVKRKDGSIFYADIKGSSLNIGTRPCMMGVFRDISERNKSEAALRQAAAVFESSHDGIMITDPDAHILAVNRSFQTITGYSEAEVLGKNPNLLQSGRHKKDFYQSMWAEIRANGYWQGDIWNRRKNGETFPAWLTISAVHNDLGDITRYVGVFSDLSQLKNSETQLEHLAHYDPLTDLPNRLLVLSHLNHTLSRAQRHHVQAGVLYLDLDRFKNVNESLGYPVGDELLVSLAERLTMHMRSEDMLARMGGDEFLLVLEHINEPEDAAVVARSLLELLAQPFVLSSGEQEIFIGASIGISIFPNDGSSADQLIRYADAAMHQAKQQGRNTWLFYTESLTRASGTHLELETRLRHAINTQQLRVYYQPQVDIASGHIVGAEALVRWQDPERGLISPADFIPLAEETGLIGAIGEWVLKEACLQGVRWIDAGLPFLTLAVNLSPHQFMRGSIVDVVSRVLAETGFPADRLELELTESALMQQEENAVKMLHLLRAQMIRLAIDDFGTGYSSLAYLKRFPLDILKIDKSFVDDIPFHQDDMEIAATIIAMGHSLGFKVLAEGVETVEQLAFLQMKGCDLYQGYLTSPPVPADEFETLLRRK